MVDEIGQKLAEIRVKLTELADRDPKDEMFGASTHRYELGRPISEDQLTAMERNYHARLPDEYRRFLLELGHGGVGPYYGIFPLESRDPEDLTDYGALSDPFPWTEAFNPVDGSESTTEWDEEIDEEVEFPYISPIPGALYICHYGCALRFFLVVNGPCQGEVWHDWQADEEGIYPAKDETGKRLLFLDWYLQWLDRSLRELKTTFLPQTHGKRLN